MEDSFLIEQVLAGDTSAFKFLVLRYQRPVFKFLRGFGLDGGTIEELAQETFVRAFENLGRYSPAQAQFGTWVFQIAKNLALNESAKAWRKKEITDDTLPEVASHERGQEAILLTRESSQALALAMQKLPTEFRSAVSLACIQELSLENVAQIENCSVGTVKSRVFRGKQLLRSLLLKTSEAK